MTVSTPAMCAKTRPPLNAAHSIAAIIRMCLEVPGCINSDSYEEVGRLLWPALMGTGHALAEKESEDNEWYSAINQARAENDPALYRWLGKELCQATRKFLPVFRAALDYLELHYSARADQLDHRVQQLAHVYGFSDTEARIANLACRLHQEPNAIDHLDLNGPPSRLYRAVAAAISMAPDAVAQVFQDGGALRESCLLDPMAKSRNPLTTALSLSRFGMSLFDKRRQAAKTLLDAVLESPLPPPNPSALAADLPSDQRMAIAILKNALASRTVGVNLLLYGPPGAGKTAFVQRLTALLSSPCHVIPYQDGDGMNLPYAQRLAALQLAQRSLARQPAVLLCDKADGMLTETPAATREAASAAIPSRHLGWFKRMLQSNACPVIWVMEEVEGIEHACLERFSACVHLDAPTPALRKAIVQEHFAAVPLSEQTVAAVAQSRAFSEPLVAATARAASLAADSVASHDEAVLCLLNGHAQARHLPVSNAMESTPMRFDLAYLRVEGSYSAAQVMAALVRNGKGSVLMSGPPGTGKTQFAAKIAEVLGREMLYVTASDIFARYVGESEQNVANLFRSCDPKEQMIFLDEAETLLSAREADTHRAAQSVTAEFLRWLEPFPGIVLCATNHANYFDSALMRRFTFRLQFKPLSAQQREQMLRELATAGPALPDACLHTLSRLDGLTPGDFANVKRRFELLSMVPTAEDWLRELSAEMEVKPEHGGRAPLGFY